MKLLYKFFKQNPDTREGVITTVSGLGVLVNAAIAIAKVILGYMTSSLAIVSEGINNASDAMTSILTIVGTKLASRHPDKNHPFGYGRIEYLTSLIIAVLVLVASIELLIDSVKSMINPEKLEITYTSIIIVAITAVIKYILGSYTAKTGERVNSSALVAVGIDSKNDSMVSLVTIVSSLVFLLAGVSIDAYASFIISFVILKSGYEILMNTVSELLGRPGQAELAETLYGEIRNTKGILNAADMILHNYGPNAYSGSVNVEMDHEKTVGEIYAILHKLQLHIMHEHNVTMVFGVYAVDNDHSEIKPIRKAINDFVKAHDHVESYHAIYLEPETNKLYCDLVVDYEIGDWEKLNTDFLAYMGKLFPHNEVVLTIETAYV